MRSTLPSLSANLSWSLPRKACRAVVALSLIGLVAGLSAGQSVAHAEATLSVRQRLVEEALQVSQTPRVMEALSEAMIETVARTPQLARLKPEQRARLSAAVGRAYSPRRFVNRIRDLLLEHASEHELQEFVRYSQLPLAQRALEMEIVASSAHSDLITRHARASVNDPETMQRIAAVRRMDTASGGSDMLLAISVATALSSADMQRRLALEQQGASGDRHGDEGPAEERQHGQRQHGERSAEELASGAASEPGKSRLQASKAEVERLSRSLRPTVYRDAVNSALFAYRWLTLTELMEYTELQEKPAMRKVASLINDALGSVFLVAQTDANEQMLLEFLGKGETPT
jgi:hypothetical protein